MDNETLAQIREQLFNKKSKDYTNLTFFFLIFSIFAFFVIRPSLTTAFSLQVTEGQLRQTEVEYEEVVSRIPAIQASLEELRPDQYLITEALPPTPNLNSILQEVRAGSERAGMPITKMTVNDVSLAGKPKPALKQMLVEVESETTFDRIIAFQQEIHNQKRLKKVKNFEIIKENSQASTSGLLRVRMHIEGFYL